MVHLISILPPASALINFLRCFQIYLYVFYPHLKLIYVLCETENTQSSKTLGSLSRRVVYSSNSISRGIHSSCRSGTRLSSNSISTILRHDAKYQPSGCEIFASSLSDFPLLLLTSSGIETPFRFNHIQNLLNILKTRNQFFL